jgi:hypothetical protein
MGDKQHEQQRAKPTAKKKREKMESGPSSILFQRAPSSRRKLV